MQRDLDAYFRTRSGKRVTVGYEFLRDGPTQSGIAYPKFYLWATVRLGDAVLEEGAARVAGIEQNGFDITDFILKAEILAHPKKIHDIFPAPVCEKIEQKLGIRGS